MCYFLSQVILVHQEHRGYLLFLVSIVWIIGETEKPCGGAFHKIRNIPIAGGVFNKI